MNKISTTCALAGLLLSGAFIASAQADTLQVSGTLNKLTTGPLPGTTFITWKINMPTGGNLRSTYWRMKRHRAMSPP